MKTIPAVVMADILRAAAVGAASWKVDINVPPLLVRFLRAMVAFHPDANVRNVMLNELKGVPDETNPGDDLH